jgi:predicted glycoside hydrolase/deacetylase ChbG (UPF0249 family)
MIIVNADDFGRSRCATDRTLECYRQGSITSTSAMVFMADSQRAAELVKESGINTGLHINFTQMIIRSANNPSLWEYQNRLVKYLNASKYNYLMYNPTLRSVFIYVFRAQYEEFERLFDMSPSHINGHHHMHLCANMLIGGVIPKGQKIRRSFSFARGEKNLPNRIYRAIINRFLERKYITTEYFFSLSERLTTGRLESALNLARTSSIEIQTHPENDDEFRWLEGKARIQAFSGLQMGNYDMLGHLSCRKKALSRRRE